MQAGGHRFETGQLHQVRCGGLVMESFFRLLSGLGVFLIPIVAVIVGGVIAVTKMILNHQERIAMIERGTVPPPRN